ncbi:28S ribosomal protein S18b, mitochondrial [Trichoplax sp. H2]|nr:28S ribosomal protein S18b, mitochondrial [Trichoplax sp. H2]|eukprot:RDD37874.1 28S ribosomal protein S18b, mitochondrial [Trichoplax sp. H2]
MLSRWGILDRRWISAIRQLAGNGCSLKPVQALWSGWSRPIYTSPLSLQDQPLRGRGRRTETDESRRANTSTNTTTESKPVWASYRRNHKGMIPPQKTRLRCVRRGKVASNPCPICRQKSGTLDYTNVNFLKQFISPFTGKIYEPFVTGVCRLSHKRLVKSIEKSRNLGLLPTPIPLNLPIPEQPMSRNDSL